MSPFDLTDPNLLTISTPWVAQAWHALLRDLHTKGRLVVQHEPWTPRYERARLKLRDLLAGLQVLGWQHGEQEGALELALWALDPNHIRRGWYACVRVVWRDGAPTYAHLYCFYDGRDQIPSVFTLATARSLARDGRFHVP